MKINIKVFQGQECCVEASESMTVREVKQQVSQVLNVPVTDQKLLLCGRPLADEKSMGDYPSIKEGTRLNLVIRRTEVEEENTLRTAVVKFLCNHFNDMDSQRIADEFIREFNNSMSTLNLEDIEKIAASYLEEEKSSGS